MKTKPLTTTAVRLAGALLGLAVLLPPAVHAARVKAVEYIGDHVFLTAHAGEIAALDSGQIPGWTRTGLELWVDDAPGTGLAPVCRFFSAHFAPSALHFLTAFEAECAALKASPVWTYEGIAFHVPLPDPIEGGGAICDAGTFPVFRWYNNGQRGVPRHAFTPYGGGTTDPARRQGGYAENGWASEGMGYVEWRLVYEDEFESVYYGQDGIAFCTFAATPGAGSFDRDKAAARGLALASGTRWMLQSAQRGPVAMEFAGEIVEQSGYRHLPVTVGERSGSANWIGSNGQLGLTLAPPSSAGNSFQLIYLTYVGRNVLEGCLYEQIIPWGGEGFGPCERIVATRH